MFKQSDKRKMLRRNQACGSVRSQDVAGSNTSSCSFVLSQDM